MSDFNIEDKVNFLKDNLDKQILSFGDKKLSNRRKSFASTIFIALFSGAVTVLIGLHGLSEESKTFTLNMALVLSALVAVSSVYESFYSHKELWIKYTEISNDLKELRSNLDFLTVSGCENIDVSKVDRIYDDYIMVLKRANTHWTKIKGSSQKKQ